MNKRETDRLFMEKIRATTGLSNDAIGRLAKTSKGRFQRLVAPYVLLLKKEMEHSRRRRLQST